MNKIIQLSVLLLFAPSFSFAQDCASMIPAPPNVSCGTGTLLTSDNTTISSGQTYYYSGPPASFSNTQIQGGTLVICDSVTMNGFTFDQGNLIVTPGGNITFNNYYNGGSVSHYFYNYGTVNMNVQVNLQGSTRFVYNAPGAILTSNTGMNVFNGGIFINEGQASAQSLQLNGGANVCLGNNSQSSLVNIYNDQNNGVAVPSGIACISYTGSFGGNAPISSTPNLRICQAPGANNPAPNVVGNATLVTNCTNCISALPLRLLSFTSDHAGAATVIRWATAWERELSHFLVEQSEDANSFTPVARIPAKNSAASYEYFTNIDKKTYFRLNMLDHSGASSYSGVISSLPGKTEGQAKLVFPTILSKGQQLTIKMPGELAAAAVHITLSSVLGTVHLSQEVKNNPRSEQIVLPTDALPAGSYIVIVQGAGAKFHERIVIH